MHYRENTGAIASESSLIIQAFINSRRVQLHSCFVFGKATAVRLSILEPSSSSLQFAQGFLANLSHPLSADVVPLPDRFQRLPSGITANHDVAFLVCQLGAIEDLAKAQLAVYVVERFSGSAATNSLNVVSLSLRSRASRGDIALPLQARCHAPGRIAGTPAHALASSQLAFGPVSPSRFRVTGRCWKHLSLADWTAFGIQQVLAEAIVS